MNAITNYFPKRAIHFDFHTMPGCNDVGTEFNGREFAVTLQKAKVEYINIFAKCNLGFCYYPTRIGTVYPGLKFDLMGEIIHACKKAGIRVAVYFNAGLSHEEALRHREWCTVNESGQVYAFDKMNHWFRTMCFNSGYRVHLLAMIREVLEHYPVDGLIFDSMNMPVCYGIECLEKMRSLGMDPKDRNAAENFAYRTKIELKNAIAELAHSYNEKLFLYFLGVEAREQPTHVELEVLPQGGWGYDYLPSQIRYIRTLGKPYYTMTGRFQRSWGDLGGIRPEAALLYDCMNSIANGGTCCIGDHLHPRGKLQAPVYEMIGRVYGKTAALDEWTDKAKSVAEIAILAPWLRGNCSNRGNKTAILAGASRMLSELKHQYDVIDDLADFTPYRILFLPDDVRVNETLAEKLEQYLSEGGKIISSGHSALNAEGNAFMLSCLKQSLHFKGDETFNYTFLHVAGEIADGIPDMGITVYEQGIAVSPKKNARSFAALGRGYFNFGDWDLRHEYLYIPEKEMTDHAGLVRMANGDIWHFSFPIALNYFRYAPHLYKRLLGNVLKQMLPVPLLTVENLPSYGVATLTEQKTRTMIHLLCYVPEKRGGTMEIIEEPSIAVDLAIQLRTDGRKARQAYLVPSRERMDFSERNGILKLKLPKLSGGQIIAVEWEQ